MQQSTQGIISAEQPKSRQLTPEEREWVVENLGLAFKIANRYARFLAMVTNNIKPYKLVGQFAEDLAQAAVIGLCESCLSFDPSYNTKRSTHATFRIRHRVQRAALVLTSRIGKVFNSFSRKYGVISLSDKFSETKDCRENLQFDVLDRPEYEEPRETMMPETKCILSLLLKPKHVEVLVRRFEKGETLQQIADDWGVSKERVRQVEAKAIERAGEAKQIVNFLWNTVEKNKRMWDSRLFPETGTIAS